MTPALCPTCGLAPAPETLAKIVDVCTMTLASLERLKGSASLTSRERRELAFSIGTVNGLRQLFHEEAERVAAPKV